MPTYRYSTTDVSINSRSRNFREPSSSFGAERRTRVECGAKRYLFKVSVSAAFTGHKGCVSWPSF